jgi:prevent-host-death family protein
LGERVTGSHEVAGSSPASSTTADRMPITIASNPFRDRLGHWMDRVAAGEDVVIPRHGKPRIRLAPAGA